MFAPYWESKNMRYSLEVFFYPIAHFQSSTLMLDSFYQSSLQFEILNPDPLWNQDIVSLFKSYALDQIKQTAEDIFTNTRLRYQTQLLKIINTKIIQFFHSEMARGQSMASFFRFVELQYRKRVPYTRYIEVLKGVAVVRYACFQQIGKFLTLDQAAEICNWMEQRKIKERIQDFIRGAALFQAFQRLQGRL